MRPSSRDDLRSTHPQKRSQAAQEARACPAAGRGTRRGRRWCDRCRDAAGDPAQHRRVRQHVAVALAQQDQCGTVAFGEHVITCTQPVAEHVLAIAIAIAK